jgi:acetyl/propionyl-CoA carboxylase alpha subunit
VIRTCKRLGIRTVAVYSEADRDAPHVHDADEAVAIGPLPAKDSYLNIDAILGAIRRRARRRASGVRLSEREERFARAVAEAGAVFIGPPRTCSTPSATR